jgi:exonuclease SbcC
LKKKIQAKEQDLNVLGPETSIAEAEAEIERLDKEIVTLETERDALQNVLSDRHEITVAAKARLEEMLTAVPEALRNQNALIKVREGASQELTDRRQAKANAEAAVMAAREAALAAQKDRQAAEEALSSSKERHRKATDIFQSRLEQVGLSDNDFRILKPFIETIDEDRVTVEGFRRKLENAKETAKRTAEAIEAQVRPDLQHLGARQGEDEKKLAEAMGQRIGAKNQLDHLEKLRDELAETLRRLDDAEAASGDLRNLAALVNGDNPQKLDLETFAIGAMFDQVLEAANLRLGPMTVNRYQLQRDQEGAGRERRRGLGIQVLDVFTGKARPTITLSGGETFIAALALALGLADVVESTSGKVRLDTIFIDEGFGCLDTENESGTLDQVLQVLSSLVSQNRAIGLISHVPLVQEAIPNGFYVRKHLTGSSVETRGVV